MGRPAAANPEHFAVGWMKGLGPRRHEGTFDAVAGAELIHVAWRDTSCSREREELTLLPEKPPLWDRRIEDCPFIFIDLEMNGLDPEKHQIIEICLLSAVGTEVTSELDTLIALESGQRLKPSVHGISPEMLAPAPTFAAMAEAIETVLAQGLLVAHGGKLDVRFLQAAFERTGRSWTCPRFIDTMHLSRQLIDLPSHRLAALAEHLKTEHKPHHRASPDAWTTRDVLAALLEACPATTPAELWLFQRGRGAPAAAIFEAAESALRRMQPVRVQYRTAKRGRRTVHFVVTAIQRELDPPLVLGYLHDTRGALRLRADRILAIEPMGDP